jgi:hypothetical protein
MPIVSNAIIRVNQKNNDGTEREDRIFKRPDGDFTRASYDDEEIPDNQPQGGTTKRLSQKMRICWCA